MFQRDAENLALIADALYKPDEAAEAEYF